MIVHREGLRTRHLLDLSKGNSIILGDRHARQQVRWVYRMLRKAGTDATHARWAVYDLLFLGHLNGRNNRSIDFVSAVAL